MNELVWWPHRGYGFQPGTFDYSESYWDEYRKRDTTNIGRVLTRLRQELINEYAGEPERNLVDVGVGGGAFVERMRCLGVDVNPEARTWLKNTNRWWCNDEKVMYMTFWDSIEHINNPSIFLEKCTERVFLSTPIYESAEHVIHSKHYKPGEHLWYFSDRGIKFFMARNGFCLLHQDRREESVGRDGIGTYVFERC